MGYVHIFYPVCPGLAKLYRRGDEICTRPYGLGCVPMIYLRRCASARHPRSVARIMGQTKQYLQAYKQLSRVIVASRYMRDLMVQNGLPADRVDILPYFIPTPDGAKLAARSANGKRPRIMFAGRLEYEKGIPYLLQAVRKIKTPHCLLIAGDGSLRSQYRQLADDLGVAGQVEFAQWLAPDELQAAYRDSAVTVMPTIMAEPFGKVGVEAMANGRPVVAFNVGGIPDWLIDGHNGFLVPPRDVDQLAARLEQLLVDTELADELGRNGRAYVEAHYSYDKHLDDLTAILQRTVQAGN
ncbi:MAG: glycosyltransferase [Anaerolineae bacterium]